MGAAGVGATIYWGSRRVAPPAREIAEAFAQAHELGMFTVLWCYVRNGAFKTTDATTRVAADLTGQANHLGVTIQADIIKQKLPENNGGFNAAEGLRQDRRRRSTRSSRPTTRSTSAATRWPTATWAASGLINSRRRVQGKNDMAEAVRTAVINKRAGGMGLISGRKAFQRPMSEGVEILNAIQDVYLSPDVTIA